MVNLPEPVGHSTWRIALYNVARVRFHSEELAYSPHEIKVSSRTIFICEQTKGVCE